MLELAIGRALARSGSMAGYEILIDYLDDSRSLLGRSALLECTDSAANDMGSWRRYGWNGAPAGESSDAAPLAILLDIECNSEDMRVASTSARGQAGIR